MLQETTKRVLCTGITSIHGWPAFTQLAQKNNIELYGIKPPKAKKPYGDNVFTASLSNPEEYKKIFDEVKPTHVLHAAGVCDLNACEANPDLAYTFNVKGATLVSELSKDAYLLYCSADLVFSGENTPEGGYTEEHTPDPISIVGKSYLLAEEEIKKHANSGILRVALPMGDSIQGYKGAVDFIENRYKKQLPVTLFYDEHRSAILTEDLGKIIAEFLLKEINGLYHAGGPRPVSLYQMGETILTFNPEYDRTLLKGRYTHEEQNGPPRVKYLQINSSKTYKTLGLTPKCWLHTSKQM